MVRHDDCLPLILNREVCVTTPGFVARVRRVGMFESILLFAGELFLPEAQVLMGGRQLVIDVFQLEIGRRCPGAGWWLAVHACWCPPR